MVELLTQYLTDFVQLSENEKAAFEQNLQLKKLKKKELFIADGTVCNKVLFFVDGYFRFFHNDKNGIEITSDFYFAPGFITSYTSFITGKPSFVNVQCMMDIDILEFKKTDILRLYEQYPKFERMGRLIAESVAINSEEHLFLLLNQTAEVRYKMLLDKNPEYVKSIPLQYIASYLGITKETLSRIRKTIP